MKPPAPPIPEGYQTLVLRPESRNFKNKLQVPNSVSQSVWSASPAKASGVLYARGPATRNFENESMGLKVSRFGGSSFVYFSLRVAGFLLLITS